MTTLRFSFTKLTTLVFLLLSFGCEKQHPQVKKGYLDFKTTEELHNYFRYQNDGSILISGHRGGRERNFPENCIATMEDVLEKIPAFFEIDPRLTKDSVIVLMHDETLDRTTTGTGKLADYTWEELQSINLKDSEGNPTSHKIPTLEETIRWSKGKTVINLDKKDVPMEMIADLIDKHEAQNHVMLTVHSGEQARFYYDRFPGIMLSVFSRNAKEYDDMALSGVPWENMIAYVGRTIDENNEMIVSELRSKGVRCMVSCAPTHDKITNTEEREKAYQNEILKKPDIIESDLPVEVWSVIAHQPTVKPLK